ncbi:MAG: T9SS type A sorting domain-containing protein, partial [Bacteroidales bacterium]
TAGKQEQVVDISGLKSGMYIAILKTDKSIKTTKFVLCK